MWILKILFFLGLSLFLTFSSEESITPSYHNPAEILEKIHHGKNPGKGVYDVFCAVCHDPDPVIAVGAPLRGVEKDWVLRCRQRNLKAMLIAIDGGMNNMPPRGGCFECTDEDLIAAIKYILNGLQDANPRCDLAFIFQRSSFAKILMCSCTHCGFCE